TTLAQIDEHIDANAMEKIDLHSLADIAAMPVGKFVRAFKRTTGQTPFQYMLQSRLRKAQRLVGTTSFPIAQIATDCGFASQSHMTDLFRTKLGCTPGQLRK
ncbi:MAG: AraC family transcriptional regulator, partial [Pseudomonadota bacterium]